MGGREPDDEQRHRIVRAQRINELPYFTSRHSKMHFRCRRLRDLASAAIYEPKTASRFLPSEYKAFGSPPAEFAISPGPRSVHDQ